MAKDLLYYYNKPDKYISGGYIVNPFVAHELGEIQSDFNMSQVIDGTKDSMKVQVLSFVDNPITPYTIIWHRNTDTWWIVSHDKIERHEHEGQPYWLHNIELVGLIELLNARDLTNCGFNKDRYTFETFIQRLFKLSNLEFRDIFITTVGQFRNIVDLNQKIDYVKTFENYTLLSALREFLDGYNLTVKARISFRVVGRPRKEHVDFFLDIYPKTGNTNRVYDESIFTSVEETQTMDKDSHGTIVVSNAQNVISTQTKTFPSVGSVKLSGIEYEIKPENACIRLPSPAYKVNWVRMYNTKLRLLLFVNPDFEMHTLVNTASDESIEETYNLVIEKIEDNAPNADEFISTFPTWQDFKAKIIEETSVVFYEDNIEFDPNKETSAGTSDETGVFYSPSGYTIPLFRALTTSKYWVLGKNSLRNGVSLPWQVMYWESGSDLIKGFDYFSQNDFTNLVEGGIIRYNFDQECDIYRNALNTQGLYVDPPIGGGVHYVGSYFGFNNISFVVNYIPMNDVKIKIDNSKDNFDTQYYNQSGKLTDSSALSKLLLSYSKEIESITITKYGVFYDYSTMPKVGGIVLIDNKPYVINNISYNFNQNEDDSYVIYGEFTMSLYVATKSLMANPNTNIRDYNIPQTQNVRRVQVYKDYWDFILGEEAINNDEYYMPLSNFLNVNQYGCSNVYQGNQSHIAMINVFDEEEGNYYYQLETTLYNLKKSVYEVLDFKDNNIIGYSPCNTRTGLDFSRLINDGVIVNTPVNYVNNIGEIEDIYLLYLNKSQFNSIWEEYKEDKGLTGDYSYENYSVIIDYDLFILAEANNDFKILEEYYNKDATEVPVFEYVCEVNDTDQIIVGDNILNFLETDQEYFYCFKAVPKGSNNNNIDTSTLQDILTNQAQDYTYVNEKAVIIEVSSGNIYLNFMNTVGAYHGNFDYDGSGSFNDISDILNVDTQDLLIYRIAKTDKSEMVQSGNQRYYNNLRKEIMFIISGQAIKDNPTYVGTSNMVDSEGHTVNDCLYLWLSVNNYKL